MKWRHYIFTAINFFCFVFSLFGGLHRILITILLINLLVMVLQKLGKGIVLRELMALYMSFICLLMPLMGYIVYTPQHPLSLLWLRYMTYPENEFFGFCLPAVAGYCLALCWPMADSNASDEGDFVKKKLSQAKQQLERIPKTGTILMALGVLVFGASDFMPAAVQFAFLLFFFAAFAGLLYVYYQPYFKRKYLILTLFAAFIIGQSLRSGMFTIVAYMGVTLFSFFFIGKKTVFWKKFVFFVLGVLLVFSIQSVKVGYRKQIWNNTYEGSSLELFGNLIKEQFSNLSGDNISDMFFPIYYRANQGFNVGLVMHRFPQYKDFDNGGNLGIAIASSFVPRVFWPDKPEAGGRSNMAYYTGYIIEGWSTNVGPLGEAYGSFGKSGGIIYMIVLGLFIRWCYRKVFQLSNKLPLLLFWIPVIFYQVTYSAEADTLQILNSIVKSSAFIFLLYKIWPKWFGITSSVFDRVAGKRTTSRIKEMRPGTNPY